MTLMNDGRHVYRRLLLGGFDLVSVLLAMALAFFVRFDFSLPELEQRRLIIALLLVAPIKFIVFQAFGLPMIAWRFTGLREMVRIFAANVAASILFAATCYFLIGPAFSRGVYVIDGLLCFLLMTAARCSVRLVRELAFREWKSRSVQNLLIYGAMPAGVRLAREIRCDPKLGYRVAGFLDDDPKLQGATFEGVRVLGTGRDALAVVERHHRRPLRAINKIIIALPSATGPEMREAVANCRAAGVPFATIPGVAEMLEGKVLATQVRDVAIDDLLGREPVQLDESRVRRQVAGRSVLVTGGAGSIGSEICRQIAGCEPTQLTIFDQSESDLYRIELELRGRFPHLKVCAELGDIRDLSRVEEVLRTHDVQLIFHAAAYKHVPMLESNILEGLQNNVIGTWNLVRAAQRHGVAHFLMISSDKAVRPSSLMGSTKRVAELILSSVASDRHGVGTNFVSVRFGNVLGSNGSVVPLFRSQIAAGGPVTITHPDVRRYFMTTREAVQLVLQASTMGASSEVFVLDMGEPIRIVDLARNMIRLSGLEPGEDIEIRYIGLRPGERLTEELLLESEETRPTHHHKIRICRTARVDRDLMERWIQELTVLLDRRDQRAAVEHLRVLVPEYKCPPAEETHHQVASATH